MTLVLIGDTHSADGVLAALVAAAPVDVPIIHVGDIGLWPQLASRFVALPRPIYFIEGNHDHLPTFAGITEPTELWPGMVYVPRGTVLSFGGVRVGFLGGATSVDRKWRPRDEGWHAWFAAEDVTAADADKLIANGPVNLMVTHCPPESVINRNFERPGFLKAFELPADWTDPSAQQVERAWQALGKPPLVCGHMHRSVTDGPVRILDINEVYVWEAP